MNATLESLHHLRSRLRAEQAAWAGHRTRLDPDAWAIVYQLLDEEIADQQAWEIIDQMSPEELDADLRAKGYDPDEFVERLKGRIAEWGGELARVESEPSTAAVDTEATLKRVASIITPRRYWDSPWRPIETAPRSGTWIVVAGPSGYTTTPLRIEVCRYVSGYLQPWRNHANDSFMDGGEAPTLWMPLPTTP